MYKKINAAVVGGGAFGECHLKTYSSMPHVDVAGVYTRRSDRAAALCAKYGGKPYTSLQQLADDPAVDLVSIATAEDVHVEPFRAIAARGKAIYVEKPLATDLEDAKAIVEMSQAIIAMSGHCLRFESRLAHVFQNREGLGRLRHMSFKDRRTRQPKQLYGRVHPAYVLLCHEIELANAFAGVPFKRVCALQAKFDEGQFDDFSMLVEYENGATCVIEGGWLMPDQKSLDENDMAVLDFDGGSYSIEMPHSGITFLNEESNRFINQHYEHSVYGMEFGALRNALEYMVQCITTNTKPRISTVEDGYNAVLLVDAAIRSAQSGQWVQRECP